MSEQPHGAILQRDKTTYAIVPRTPAGIVSAEVLERLSAVARRYQIPIVKITSGQRLALVGIRKEDLPGIWQDLAMDAGRALELCLHYVQACPGNTVCSLGLRDSLSLGLALEQIFMDMALPAKLKMGVSGCSMCCGESYLRDVGVIGKKAGWTLTFGGNSGGRPRIADVLAEGLSDDEVVAKVRRVLEYYRGEGKKKERTARFVERMGVAAVQAAVA
ncbi:MAG: NAD(P)/FAD-dependent oxidoreductase [Thermodesulfobacteriota bacterium]